MTIQAFHLIQSGRPADLEVNENPQEAALIQLLPRPTGPNPIEHTRGKIVQVASADEFVDIETYVPQCPGKMPCLIFSHGWEKDPMQYRPLMRELASHGYIIISINHPSSSKPFPLTPETEKQVIRDRIELQAENIECVVEQVRRGEFVDLRISDKIILAGHSMGGAASVLVARKDPQFAACINLDGELHGDDQTRTVGLKMPLLHVSADHLKDAASEPDQEALQKWVEEKYNLQVRDWHALVENSQKPHKFEKIPGIGHEDPRSLEAPMRAHEGTSQAILQFMSFIREHELEEGY
jgi:dienelactone hydrolase